MIPILGSQPAGDVSHKPGFSQDTSVFSALETFVITALYKLTFTIPYLPYRQLWNPTLGNRVWATFTFYR